MIDLEEHLERLAEGVTLPDSTPHDDLTRGRARRRRRDLGAVGAAALTAAVIGTSVVLLSGGGVRQGTAPSFAGSSGPDRTAVAEDARQAELDRLRAKARAAAEKALSARAAADAAEQRARHLESITEARTPHTRTVLAGYRDILREDLDPAGTLGQQGPITNEQSSGYAALGLDGLGTKLSWNGGGMLQVAVGQSLEAVQFFCNGGCTQRTVTGASKALVLTSPGEISVAVFQDDGDVVALTADTAFGNNGTSTSSLGLTVDQLLTAAADPRLDLPVRNGQPSGLVDTQ